MTTQVSAYTEQFVHEIKETPEEYLPALLKMVRLFRESVVLNPAEVGFRRGCKEALTGETKPVSGLWEGIGVSQPDHYR
jgi:hypothetical protein